jgi:hypothetical protein
VLLALLLLTLSCEYYEKRQQKYKANNICKNKNTENETVNKLQELMN